MSNSLQEILNRRGDAIEAPKPLPQGTYRMMIDISPKIDAEKGIVEFTCKVLGAEQDVDAAGLATIGGTEGKTMRLTRWLLAAGDDKESQDRQDYGNKKFFTETLGLEANMSLGEWIANAPGRQFLGTVKHAPSKDGTQMYANIGMTARYNG